MSGYIDYKFEDSEEFINTFDEAPLWSAAFGLLLFKHLDLIPNIKIIDIGSGAGFPLMELAGRFGPSCKIYGIDPWLNANQRVKQKIKQYGYQNVELFENSAETIPFENNSIDLIVSNLGINNFENPGVVFKECHRVLKKGGKLAITTNLNGHWKEFYTIFYKTLEQLNKDGYIPFLKKDEEHRSSIESLRKLFQDNGFKVCKLHEEHLEMKFMDGTAFLNHHFIQLGWLTSWLTIFPKEELTIIFSELERNLNVHAFNNSGLLLTVPMAYLEGLKE
ncbi:MAG: class I SAM-dependent methyltransferase [Saprospiraceae bacterium]